MGAEIERFQVHLVNLNPTRGAEMRKMRPVVVISPDEINRWLFAVVVAPMTTTIRPWPFRVDVTFDGKRGQIALDQLRGIDKTRCREYLGDVNQRTAATVSRRLQQMFSL